MARYSQEAVIQAPPQQVFDYVADLSRHGEWGAHGLTVQQTSPGPVGLGATFASEAKQFGTQREKQTITEFAPTRSLAFEATGGLGVARHAFELTPRDGGTQVVKSMELIKPSLLARIMGFQIGRQQPKALAEDLRKIKVNLESSQAEA